MANPTTQLRGSATGIFTTELNSMANNALVLSGSAINTAGYLMIEVELVIASMGGTPTANTGFSIWFLREIDGSDYEDGGTSVTPARAPDLVLGVRAVSTAQRLTKACPCPPGNTLVLIKNDGTGQALASSGNTLKFRAFTPQT